MLMAKSFSDRITELSDGFDCIIYSLKIRLDTSIVYNPTFNDMSYKNE